MSSIANVVEVLIRGCYGRDGIAIAHGKADVNNKTSMRTAL